MEYLDYEVTKIDDSVENIFCKPLDEEGKTNPLNDSQMQIVFLSLTLKEEEMNGLYAEIEKNHLPISILKNRLESLNCSSDKGSLVTTALFCDTPGEAVMYANYIAYKVKKLGLESFSINNLCTDIFPFGSFTKETLNNYWDKQKVRTGVNRGSDNLLDYPTASASISK